MWTNFFISSLLPSPASYPTVPLVPPPRPQVKPPQIPYPVEIGSPCPLPPLLFLPPSPPILPVLQPSSAAVRSPHHFCQAVGHVRTRAKPGQSVHWGQHSSAQGVLGLWVPRSWMGVNVLLTLLQTFAPWNASTKLTFWLRIFFSLPETKMTFSLCENLGVASTVKCLKQSTSPIMRRWWWRFSR